MTIAQQERTASAPHGFDVEVTSGLERYSVAAWRTRRCQQRVSADFQPVAYAGGRLRRAAARARCARSAVSPLDVFGEAARVGDVLQVDRLAADAASREFQGARRRARVAVSERASRRADRSVSRRRAAGQSQAARSTPRRIVLEVLEHRADDLERLADAVRQFRERGFLIALDDFGAGHSNVERIWQLIPISSSSTASCCRTPRIGLPTWDDAI